MAEKKNPACATRLETLRSGLAVTWTELADLLGISRKYLFMLRAGTRNAGPAFERKMREIENKLRDQNGNSAGPGGNGTGTVREAPEAYAPMTDRDRLLLNLATENASLKARLEELDERLRRMERGKQCMHE